MIQLKNPIHLENPPRYLRGIERNLRKLEALKRDYERKRSILIERSKVLESRFTRTADFVTWERILDNRDKRRAITSAIATIEKYIEAERLRRKWPFKEVRRFKHVRKLKRRIGRVLKERGQLLEVKKGAHVKVDEKFIPFIKQFAKDAWENRTLRPRSAIEKDTYAVRSLVRLRIKEDKSILKKTKNMTEAERGRYFEEHNREWRKRIVNNSHEQLAQKEMKVFNELKQRFIADGYQRVMKDDLGVTFISTAGTIDKEELAHDTAYLTEKLKQKYILMGTNIEIESITIAETAQDSIPDDFDEEYYQEKIFETDEEIEERKKKKKKKSKK